MHECPHCSATTARAGGVYLLDEPTNEDLRQQVRDAHPELKPLVRSVRDRLQVQDSAAKELERGLAAAWRSVADALQVAMAQPALRARILGSNLAQMRLLIEQIIDAALDGPQRALLQRYADLTDIANVAAESAGGRRIGLDVRAFQAVVERQWLTFWQDRVKAPAMAEIMDSLISATTMERLQDSTARIAQRLETTVPRAAAAARTQIATFDRVVAEEGAVRAGLDLRWYVGPDDGITRPFCRALVGKVLTIDQVAELDNEQTPGSPIMTGGGYNCRHRFVAVSDAFVERRELPRATEDDIAAANAGARKGR